jgi:hypothetical protein
MTPGQVTDWVGAISRILALGAPLISVLTLIRAALPAADADQVLHQILTGWQAARTENEARIAELEAQLGQG